MPYLIRFFLETLVTDSTGVTSATLAVVVSVAVTTAVSVFIFFKLSFVLVYLL